ncbi:unnamed protein product [Adineta steineri]|uniref:SAM domain-containing protein n=1 Tax=Adineta steineri TaxID=433720 RepID=A0A818LTA4_9BILA|nr:unnamed protein product [Adineta steineri]CAF3573996.1 unnamed protein product [Adineta steineri]
MSSQSPTLKKNKPMKPLKFNHRLNYRMTNLPKIPSPLAIPVSHYKIIPMSTMWMDTQSNMPNSMVTLVNTSSPSVSVSPPVYQQQQQQQNVHIYSPYKSFTAPRVTTTLIPLNICPVEYSQPFRTIPTSTPLVNILENHQEQKSNDSIITHLIGDWIIRESSKPFRRKENEQVTPPIEQLVKQEKFDLNDSIDFHQSPAKNVSQWTIDDVCLFFESVLDKDCYAPLIQEHLIDGSALLLLEDEHLTSIFQMQLGPRLKLLDRIRKLKTSD